MESLKNRINESMRGLVSGKKLTLTQLKNTRGVNPIDYYNTLENHGEKVVHFENPDGSTEYTYIYKGFIFNVRLDKGGEVNGFGFEGSVDKHRTLQLSIDNRFNKIKK